MQCKFKLILFKTAVLSDLLLEISTNRNKYRTNQEVKLPCWVWFWTLNGKKGLSPLRMISKSIDTSPLSLLRIKTHWYPPLPPSIACLVPTPWQQSAASRGAGAMALRLWLVKPVSLSYYTCCCFPVFKSRLTLGNPMNCSSPGFPVLHYPPEFAQTHVYWVSDAIQPSHPPALSLSQHQGLFQWVGSLHHLAKVLERQLQH